MIRVPQVTALVATILIGTGGVHAQAPAPTYAVAPLHSDWADDRAVGRRGSGAICVPFASIAWRQVAPDPARAALRIARALKAAGMDVLASDAEEDAHVIPRYRIVARIVDLKLKACTPHFGVVRMIGGKAMKGEGRIGIAWHVRDMVAKTDGPVQNVSSDFTFRSSDEALSEALMAGLDANAAQFAAAFPMAAKSPRP